MGDGRCPCDTPMMGAATDTSHDCKTTLNIDIYPSTLVFFFENIGHKYDFEGESGWYLAGSGDGGMVQIQRKKVLTEY